MVLVVRSWLHMSWHAEKETDNFLCPSARFTRHHTAVISSLLSLFIELLVPRNDLALGAAKPIAIEDRATAYAHMPWHNFFFFALT